MNLVAETNRMHSPDSMRINEGGSFPTQLDSEVMKFFFTNRTWQAQHSYECSEFDANRIMEQRRVRQKTYGRLRIESWGRMGGNRIWLNEPFIHCSGYVRTTLRAWQPALAMRCELVERRLS